MTLNERIAEAQRRIASAAAEADRDAGEISLCAAVKTQNADTIRAAVAAGIGVCGENRVQELRRHLDEDAYGDAELHFIGHLQTNKVRQVVGRVELIESVDSVRLLECIEAEAGRLELTQEILLEVNIGGETRKSGFSPLELPDAAALAVRLPHVRLRGLMCVPPVASVPGANRHFFAEMYQLFVDIRTRMAHNEDVINCLSMGMSGDFEDAVREGATLVRLGSALFGPRPAPGTNSFQGGPEHGIYR